LAQTDDAPAPPPAEPPAAPAPSDTPAPAEPPAAPAPAEPAPPAAPAEPPATPPPATPPSAPPSGAFPPPPTAPPGGTPSQKPARRLPPAAATTPTPAASSPERTPASEPARPAKPSDGLFEPKKPGEASSSPAVEEKDEGTDQFKIGPVAGVGIPSVVSFGGTLKLTRFLGGGVNIGLIPKVKLSYYGDATLSYQHYDIYGRIYPFGGGFFLSGGAGYATVDGTLSSNKTVSANGYSGTVDYNSKGSVRTLMLTALIGYFYTTSIGFSFGVDAGAQIPIAPSQVSYSSTYDVTTTAPPALHDLVQAEFKKQADPIKQQTDRSVQDTLEKIGRTTLPTINLRIGWIL
jgi:hypothetical protein